ncbi:hypothetical protein QYM36_006174 [Artemia franciscana]|uniref:Uncharacterized protein n=1 Tax=Artemia franciscana TaxID=6661 RepID=A0AA88HW03_ARTSF|nr:hypothetical protein QYM36_006174 [Artemia franciscana]
MCFLYSTSWTSKQEESTHAAIDAMNNFENANIINDAVVQKARKPIYMNLSPVRALFRRFGLDGPYANTFLGAVSRIEVTPFLERLRLGRAVDNYQGLQENYPEELDVGFCFAEHLFYRARQTDLMRSFFPQRRARRSSFLNAFSSMISSTPSSSVFDSLVNAGVSGLLDHLTKRKTDSNFETTPADSSAEYFSADPVEEPPMTTWPEVGFAFGKRYIKKYFASAQGNSLKSDPEDDEEDKRLIETVENLGRSFMLSTFGLLPGSPASGSLPDILEGRSMPLSETREVPVSRTGNPIIDFGNIAFDTFQRASDISNSMYCAKKYIVNHLWVLFRKSARSALGFDVLARDLSWTARESAPYLNITEGMMRSFVTDKPLDIPEESERNSRSSDLDDIVDLVNELIRELL